MTQAQFNYKQHNIMATNSDLDIVSDKNVKCIKTEPLELEITHYCR